MNPAGSSASPSSGMVSRERGLLTLLELLCDNVGDLTVRDDLKVEAVDVRDFEGLGVAFVRDVNVEGLFGVAAAVDPPNVVFLVFSPLGSGLELRELLNPAADVRVGFLFSFPSATPSSLLLAAVFRAVDVVGRVGSLLLELVDARVDKALVLLAVGEAVPALLLVTSRDEVVVVFFDSSVFDAGFAPAAFRRSIGAPSAHRSAMACTLVTG